MAAKKKQKRVYAEQQSLAEQLRSLQLRKTEQKAEQSTGYISYVDHYGYTVVIPRWHAPWEEENADE